MPVVPDKRVEKVEFFENHIAPFTTNATAIGISTTEATDLQTKTEAARAAYVAQQAAQSASKDATLTFHNAVDSMSVAGAALIKKIRAKAEQTGNLDVYALASIPAPATPAPVGAPGVPYQLKVSLKPNGSIEMGWKCNNPTGCHNVIYQLYRKVETTGEFTYLGGTGDRTFVDATVPSGVTSFIYMIQGTRSTAVGDAAEFVVNFGTTSSGATTVTVTAAKGTPAKIAA